jgi:hypothetical protein
MNRGDIPRMASAPQPDRVDARPDDLNPGPRESSARGAVPAPNPVAPTPAPAAALEPSPAPSTPPVSEEGLLQQAFSALLSTEQHTPSAPPAIRLDSLPNEVLDEIARRVIARMGDESMRAAVLDAAERLVREEIARIKSQS